MQAFGHFFAKKTALAYVPQDATVRSGELANEQSQSGVRRYNVESFERSEIRRTTVPTPTYLQIVERQQTKDNKQ